ncbi:hypothetical protein LEP1GSC165_0343 [Leptospira santarosai str. CBC523]|nr:hypothetical protein LEP1GSC165_0343 [Leptospira santarosai str. CBC523]
MRNPQRMKSTGFRKALAIIKKLKFNSLENVSLNNLYNYE